MTATTRLRRWGHLWRKIRHLGPLYLAMQVVDIVVPKRLFFVEYFEIFGCELMTGAPNAKIDSEVRWATEDDLENLAKIGRFSNTIARWLGSDARAVVLVQSGTIVACLWIATGRHDQDDWLTFRLHPRDAWTITAWVLPDYRGRGYHARLWAYGTAALAAEGYRRILGHINILNRSSMLAGSS